jgi:hypothetical protein
MGFTNVFVGVTCLNMYAKGDNKKIWHEMINFVCGSKSFIIMNIYNIVSISFRFDFGHISILMYYFHKTHMYATHIIGVMEVGVKCMCCSTNALESQCKCIHEKTIDNE